MIWLGQLRQLMQIQQTSHAKQPIKPTTANDGSEPKVTKVVAAEICEDQLEAGC